MNLLVDASVVAKWLFNETESPNARSLLSQTYTLFAPDLMLIEVANVVWKKRMRSESSGVTDQIEALHRLPNAVELIRAADFLGEAIYLAVELEHPVYDYVYLAAATAIRILLITADRRLRDQVIESTLDIDVIDMISVPVHQ